MTKIILVTLGLVSTSLSAWGAWEYQYTLEGGVGYLTLAAPLVAASASIVPIMAEMYWRAGQYIKSIVWGAMTIPVVALIFLVVSERVHDQRAGVTARREAAKAQTLRLAAEYEQAKSEATQARQDASLWRTKAKCDDVCQLKHDTAAITALELQQDAEARLKQAQESQRREAPLSPPPWLLPLTLDMLSFLCLWSAFSAMQKKRRKQTRRRRVVRV